MRVGHRGFAAALAVAGGAGHRAGACRTDRQRAVAQPGDRAAAGADRHHVHHRQRQRPVADAALLGQRDPAALQQADVGAGAADIDGDRYRRCRSRGGDVARAHHAGRRPGQRGQRRRAADRRRAGDAAVRLHQQQRRATSASSSRRSQPSDIAPTRRHHARRSAPWPALRSYSRTTGSTSHRSGDRDAGQRRAQHLRDAPLVRRDRRRNAAGRSPPPARRAAGTLRPPSRTLAFVERHQHRAAGADALGRPRARVRAAPAARGLTQEKRLARRGMSCRPISSTWRKPAVVTSAVRAVLPSRIRLVATVVPCSTRGTISAACAPASRQRRPHAGQEGLRWIAPASLGVLARQDRPVAAVGQGDVGEGAADIDGDQQARRGQSRTSTYSCRWNAPAAGRSRAACLRRRRVDHAVARSPRRSAARRRFHRLTKPSRTSCSTCSAGRSNGWPWPPPPPVSISSMSPRRSTVPSDSGASTRSRARAGIDHRAAGAACHAAGHAPGRVHHAVDPHRQHRFLRQHLVFAHDAAAAAESPGAAAVADGCRSGAAAPDSRVPGTRPDSSPARRNTPRRCRRRRAARRSRRPMPSDIRNGLPAGACRAAG